MPAAIDVRAMDKVVARLPRLVLEPTDLVGVMDEISKASRSEGAVLLQADVRTPDVPHTPGIADLFKKYFGEGWHTRDIRVRAIPKIVKTGIGVDQDFATPELLRREAFYNEFLGPMGFRWFAGIGMPVNDALWCLCLQRTPRQGPFDKAQQRILARLAAPLTQAATLSAAVGRARLDGLSDGLALIDQAALILDRYGRVQRCNAAAERLLGKGICLTRCGLASSDPAANARIAELTHRIGASQPSLATRYEPIVVRRDGRPVLFLRPLALPPELYEVFTGARAIVLMQDLSRRASAPKELLRTLYRLTQAEAAIVLQIAAGVSLTEAAGRLGVLRTTARNQLAAATAKMDVHRQAEVVAAVAALGPRLALGHDRE
jgi:DNA-binding CsgD family transcriptional regulator